MDGAGLSVREDNKRGRIDIANGTTDDNSQPWHACPSRTYRRPWKGQLLELEIVQYDPSAPDQDSFPWEM